MIFFYRVRQAVDAWACNLFFWKKITFSSRISLVNLCRNCLMFKFTVRLSMPSPYILMLLSLTEVSEYAYVESCQDGKDWWFLVTFSAVPSMTQKLLKSVKGAIRCLLESFFAFCLALACCNIWIHSTCCRYARVYRGSGLSPLSHLPSKSLWRKMWFLHCFWKDNEHNMILRRPTRTDLDRGWHRLCQGDSLNP